VELEHFNTRISPQIFKVISKCHTFKARIPKPKILQTTQTDTTDWIEMRATQIPILVNNATTGHKLQGSGVDSLFVHNWSYVTNWVYTMLSRVKELNGLFARKLLSEDISKYAVPASLKRMIMKFSTLSQSTFTDTEYSTISESQYPHLERI
jgi:hypothetical protein